MIQMILQEYTEQDQLPKIQKDCSKRRKKKKNKLQENDLLNFLLIYFIEK